MLVMIALLLSCATTGPGNPSDETGAPETDPCGVGNWGDVEGTLFVDASAAEGGDGSRDAPFATLAEAVGRAGDADVIAIAAGTYSGPVAVVDRDLTLAGRCADLVTLDGTGLTDQPLLGLNWEEGSEGTIRVSGLTLANAEFAGFAAMGGTVELEGVVVRDAHLDGIRLEGVTAELTDVRIVDGRVPAEEYLAGGGLQVLFGSQVTARRLTIEHQQGEAIGVGSTDTHLSVEEGEIIGTLQVQEVSSAAVFAADGTVELHDVRIADSFITAGVVSQGNAVVELDGVTLENLTGAECPGQTCNAALQSRIVYGFGTEDDHGGRITGSGVRISGCDAGAFALHGGEIVLADLTMTDIGERQGFGGLAAGWGGRLEVSGARIERAKGTPVWAAEGGIMALTDTEIVDIPDGESVSNVGYESTFSVAANVEGGSELSLVRTRISGLRGVGLDMFPTETGSPTVRLDDVTIEDVGGTEMLRSAIGVLARAGSLVADGLSVRGVAGPGIAVASEGDPEGSVHCTDCVIEDVALAGVVVAGLAVERPVRFDGCTIAGVTLDASAGLSTGVLATHLRGPPVVELTDCDISGTDHTALAVAGEASVQVRGSTLEGGAGALVGGTMDVHGNAVYATGVGPWGGVSGLLIEDSTLVPGAGDTVLLHAGSATLDGLTWEGGTLRQQHCDDVEAVVGSDQAPTFEDCPATDQLVIDFGLTRFSVPPVDVSE